MGPLLCFPDPFPADLALELERGGHKWAAVGDFAGASVEPDDGWAGAVICAVDDPTGAYTLCRALRASELALGPILLVVSAEQVQDLQWREDRFDDFCLAASARHELSARLAQLLWRSGRRSGAELVEYGPLVVNVETYQAAVAGRVLDLTYMEYELLRFLAARPGKVFTRETLLSRVWGYEYYGGARTVDVHIRRLRAKLGEEHAHLIETVRSVGYRFGPGTWAP